MKHAILHIDRLGKLYRIVEQRAPYHTLRDTLARSARNWATFFLGQSPPSHQATIWALRNVSFDVSRGEVVGIIGHNGAGKSTLLKIISRITEPSEGSVEIRGRVGSLLEVGTGFHPEMSGRENIFLNGAILGMRRDEISRKFDEIVDFAGVEKFIDTPVKHYSSGMYMRLAFAVAAHLETEILLVDEVLAVGDAEFQKKCLGKMQSVAGKGRTVLFVSHNMLAIESLCSRAVVLKQGGVDFIGGKTEAIQRYLGSVKAKARFELDENIRRTGTRRIRALAVEFLDGAGTPRAIYRSGEELWIRIHYESALSVNPSDHLSVGIALKVAGLQLSDLWNEGAGTTLTDIPRRGCVTCRLPRIPLNSGVFSINVILRLDGNIEDWILDAGAFQVEAGDFWNSGKLPDFRQGCFLIEQEWTIQPVSDGMQGN